MRNERLVVLTGPLQGKSFGINGKVSIGRNPDNTMQLEDLQVSRKHAIIEQDGRGTILKDLGSGNGTYIGDRRVLEYKLTHGDVIKIGTQELRFEAGDSPQVTKETGDSGVRFDAGGGGQVQSSSAENVYETFFQAPRAEANAEQLRETQRRLQAIYKANQIISSESKLSKLFNRVIDQVFELVPAHNGVILLQSKDTGELVTEYVKSGKSSEEVVISSTIVKRAFEDGEAVITFDAADDARFDAGASIISQNISSAMCVPLEHEEETLGVMYVDTRGTTNAFVSGDLELLVALAGPSAIAIKNAQYRKNLEDAYQDTLLVLSNAVELRDHYTVGHTWRVTNFSIEIARELSWSAEKLDEVQQGGVLHDVGKISVDDAILRKAGPLTDEEFAKMRVHPEKGAQLLQDVEQLHPLIPYCLYHHERYDGRGYPYGLRGEDIPIEGRLMAVADTFDAMTSNRPYRKGLDPEIAISELEKNSGTQFDPACAEAMINCYRSGKIDRILQDFFKSDGKSICCAFCSTHIKTPEGIEIGDELSCGVCHRRLKYTEQNGAFYGELLPQTGVHQFNRTTQIPGPPTQ